MTRFHRLGRAASLSALLLVLAPAAVAQNCAAPAIAAVRAVVGLAEAEVLDSECRTWSFPPHLQLAAVAFQAGPDDPLQGGRPIRVGVATLAGTQVRQSVVLDASEDAASRFRVDSLRLDTARYDLAPGRRAFGLVLLTGYGPPCADGGSDGYLTLLLPDGATLQPVLAGLPMYRWRHDGECSCQCEPDQEARIQAAALTIALGDDRSAGLRDLVVHARFDPGLAGGRYSGTVRYDGSQYLTSGWEEGFQQQFFPPEPQVP